MRRIIFTVLALMLAGGVASADRWRDRPGGTVVRDHRVHRDFDRRDFDRRDMRRDYRRYDDRRHRIRDRIRVERRPVFVHNNRFVFHGGVVRHYQRPVIKYRYYDYRVRPQVIVEHYDPVPGYIWVQGQWRWNGYEWIWSAGYFAPDPSYVEPGYHHGHHGHHGHHHDCDHDDDWDDDDYYYRTY